MKKKILLLGDDLRLHSGIGTMSREIVFGTLHKYDWFQIGGAIKHPEANKGILDLSKDPEVLRSVKSDNIYLKVLPTDGYGNADIVRDIIRIEKPDAIMHFTDPRFWGWLYDMANEFRTAGIPLSYYNIWDDLPFPHWNEPFYESCDLLMAISKQTYNINKHVCQRKPRIEGVDLTYVPHGINTDLYKPLDDTDAKVVGMKQELFKDKDIDFVAFFNSRNIRRKGCSDLIHAFGEFYNELDSDEKDRVALLMHTDVVDEHGTDLFVVAKRLYPNMNVIFSTQKLTFEQLNTMYNIADVTCNPSSAEGFGLSHMESLMAGTPTISTVVGGLQDQQGWKVNGEELSTNHFTADTPSNSTGKISKEHGKWTYPLWPNPSLQGSPPTPYIYDSRPIVKDITEGLKFWYNMSNDKRTHCGDEGRKWAIKNGFTAENMCTQIINSFEGLFETYKSKKRFELIDTSKPEPIYPTGVL